MKFVCQLKQKDGTWTGEHSSPSIGPIRVTAATRDEVLRKLEAEIRYWLEMCPCSGEALREIEIDVVSQLSV